MVTRRCRIHRCKQHSLSCGRLATARPKRMEHIAPSTGSRRSRDKRTEASREKSGSMHLATSVTGKRIRRTDSAFSSTRMGTNTRGYGNVISATAKAPTGAMRRASCAVNTQETGSRIRSTAAVPFSTRTATDTMATGSLECLRAKAE